jgi:acyl-CoA reductase-like NAD-dependent aldehyde dehydrogenase
VQGSYKNSGQRCTAVKRMLVQQAVPPLHRAGRAEDARLETRRTRWTRRRHGHGDRRAAAPTSKALVNDAVAQGARLLPGNQRDGALYAPHRAATGCGPT